MQFFTEHFTKHHFFHHPHKWLAAFLVSPIHFLEMHYKTRYHLQFAHAKKLFVFDMSLLASILFLAGLTLFYFFYHGSIASLVYLNINLPEGRVLSGQYVEYTINYHNDSDIKLTKATLAVQMPKGFILDKVLPEKLYKNNLFYLPDIRPTEKGEIKISGWLYDTPNQENSILANLSYQQEKKQYKELKISRSISVLRGSVLQTIVRGADKVVNGAEVPLNIVIKNNGEQPVKDISLSFADIKTLEITPLEPVVNLGAISQPNNAFYPVWEISSLAPQQSAQLDIKIKVNLGTHIPRLIWAFTPNVKINGEDIPQITVEKTLNIIYPQAEISANWQNEGIGVQPSKTNNLNIKLTNKGAVDLNNAVVELPLPPAIVDINRARQLNLGTWQEGKLIFDKNQYPSLENIKTNESINLLIQIPIVFYPQGGTDLTMFLSPTLRAQVAGTSGIYETKGNSTPIKIGTQINLQGEVRYYTAEGDQLGRGPLPPEIGKETKYWAMITATNNTSEADNIKFTAELPAYVTWTGKTSATRGQEIKYSEKTRLVSWSTNYLAPHENIGLYFELSLTPTIDQMGKTPEILKNVSLTADDSFINLPILKNIASLDISLTNDEIGKAQGTTVK